MFAYIDAHLDAAEQLYAGETRLEVGQLFSPPHVVVLGKDDGIQAAGYGRLDHLFGAADPTVGVPVGMDMNVNPQLMSSFPVFAGHPQT